MSQKESSFNNL